MADSSPPIHCPAVRIPEVEVCKPAELEALADWLKQKQKALEDLQFNRGSALTGGRLDLCKQSIGPDGLHKVLDNLSQENGVEHLLLGLNALGDGGARQVAEFSAQNEFIRTIYLGCNKISPQGAKEFAGELEKGWAGQALWLKRNPIQKTGALAIIEAIKDDHPLKILDLTNIGLNDHDGAQIVRALTETNQNLEYLFLGGNGLGASTARELRELIKNHPNLRGLYLDTNPLMDSSTELLNFDPTTPVKLIDLSLSCCGIDSESIHVLFEHLSKHQLQRLNLGWTAAAGPLQMPANSISGETAETIANYLAINSSLRYLNLTKTGLRSEQGFKLLGGLEHNKTLLELKLGKNIAKSIKKRIGSILERNQANNPGFSAPPPHIQDILSIYRS